MFTGLIQALGSLTLLNTYQVQIICSVAGRGRILSDLALGDSVAVDGVCLTVETVLPQGFIAAVSPETLSRTTLGRRSRSDSAGGSLPVNLETSLRVGSKVGGHFVTGHVDGTGELVSVVKQAIAWEMVFRVNSLGISPYLVPKGSIAVNGISLTIAECVQEGTSLQDRTTFKVAIIPQTFHETNLAYLHPGDLVNLEGDILGKYVEQFLKRDRPATEQEDHHQRAEPITHDFLAQQGYL